MGSLPSSTLSNHPSAAHNSVFLRSYIHKELVNRSICGAFTSNPFDTNLSTRKAVVATYLKTELSRADRQIPVDPAITIFWISKLMGIFIFIQPFRLVFDQQV